MDDLPVSPDVPEPSAAPLVHGKGVSIFRVESCRQFLISVFADEDIPAVQSGLGCALPRTPNGRITGANGKAAIWLGPKQWLIVDQRRTARCVFSDQVRMLDAGSAAISEVTDGLAILEMSGCAAVDILSRITSLDLRWAPLTPGKIVRTAVAQVRCILYPTDSGGFWMHVESNVADYAMAILAETTRIYGLDLSNPAGTL